MRFDHFHVDAISIRPPTHGILARSYIDESKDTRDVGERVLQRKRGGGADRLMGRNRGEKVPFDWENGSGIRFTIRDKVSGQISSFDRKIGSQQGTSQPVWSHETPSCLHNSGTTVVWMGQLKHRNQTWDHVHTNR